MILTKYTWKFWQKVYVATLKNKGDPTLAANYADRAAQDFKNRIDGEDLSEDKEEPGGS